jgi:hypothetical protein
MDPRELFAIWAPPESIWARWAKPVIFAQRTGYQTPIAPANTPAPTDSPALDLNTDWVPADKTAIIVNLPGAESVAMGLALVKRGYRPVPLYNSCSGPFAVVPLDPIINALLEGAAVLQQTYLDPSAPPAFLLDANRLQGGRPPAPGMFDNRWMVFPQDFPSAIFFRSHFIEQIVVVQHDGLSPDQDLAYVLGPWKKAGLEMLTKSLAGAQVAVPPQEMVMNRFTHYGYRLWYPFMIMRSRKLRRSNVGGFGSAIPYSSGGTG